MLLSPWATSRARALAAQRYKDRLGLFLSVAPPIRPIELPETMDPARILDKAMTAEWLDPSPQRD